MEAIDGDGLTFRRSDLVWRHEDFGIGRPVLDLAFHPDAAGDCPDQPDQETDPEGEKRQQQRRQEEADRETAAIGFRDPEHIAIAGAREAVGFYGA